MSDQDAYILRENTGTSGVLEAARTAAALLADHDIPHLIVGGIAVQEHGYPRVTIDVDMVVPDVLEAAEFLTASLTGPFYRVPGTDGRLEDRRSHTFVDLLPAGRVVKQGCLYRFRNQRRLLPICRSQLSKNWFRSNWTVGRTAH